MLKQDARILVADDSKISRMAITLLLESLGYRNIVEVTDGAQALIEHAKEPLDLILLDIVMPNLRGDEALAKIRSTDAKTPVIMLSSVSKQSEIDMCRSHGITEYLVKPLIGVAGQAMLEAQLQRL